MKGTDYSVHKKMITLLLSITFGRRYTSDINDKLVPDTVAANIFDMDRFPDQSQINALIRRICNQGVRQLKAYITRYLCRMLSAYPLRIS